jgi:hypothetical protein
VLQKPWEDLTRRLHRHTPCSKGRAATDQCFLLGCTACGFLALLRTREMLTSRWLVPCCLFCLADTRRHHVVVPAVPLGSGVLQQPQVGLAVRPHAAVLPGTCVWHEAADHFEAAVNVLDDSALRSGMVLCVVCLHVTCRDGPGRELVAVSVSVWAAHYCLYDTRCGCA